MVRARLLYNFLCLLANRLNLRLICVPSFFLFFFEQLPIYCAADLVLIAFISYPTVALLTCRAVASAQPGRMCPIMTIVSYMCYNTNFSVGPGVHAHTSVITHLPAANLHASHYRYTADLLRLEADSSRSPATCWPSYQTPINTGAMLPYLEAFPDRDFARYIRTGLTNGFHIGFTRRRDLLRSHRHNHPSSRANPAVVDERIASELVAGRLLGPISQDRPTPVHLGWSLNLIKQTNGA